MAFIRSLKKEYSFKQETVSSFGKNINTRFKMVGFLLVFMFFCVFFSFLLLVRKQVISGDVELCDVCHHLRFRSHGQSEVVAMALVPNHLVLLLLQKKNKNSLSLLKRKHLSAAPFDKSS